MPEQGAGLCDWPGTCFGKTKIAKFLPKYLLSFFYMLVKFQSLSDPAAVTGTYYINCSFCNGKRYIIQINAHQTHFEFPLMLGSVGSK